MNEWLKIMLDEIARKTREAEEARAERDRRAAGSGDVDVDTDDVQADGK